MTALPDKTGSGSLTDNATTQAEQKNNITDMRDVIAEISGGAASAELTISSGAVTPAAGITATFTIETQGGAASDDLDTITPTNIIGDDKAVIITLRLADASHVVTLKNGTGGLGKIHTPDGNDLVLKDGMTVQLQYDPDLGSGEWRTINVNYADQVADFRTYLGLGSAATKTTGTSSGNVPLVSDADTLYAKIRQPGAQVSSELTIDTNGIVTPTRGHHTIDTFAGAATDNLDEMNPGSLSDGNLVMLRAENASRVVTIRNNQGTNKIYTADGSDLTLDSIKKSVQFRLDGTVWYETWRGGFGSNGAVQSMFNGRLTLSSGTAITTSNVTAATSVYLTPYKGNQVALKTGGSSWSLYDLTEISISLSGYTADSNYDLFLYDNAGSLELESVIWTDDSNRATAIVLEDGVYVKSGSVGKRYVGTVRITGTTGQTEDSTSKRYLFNAYNQVERNLLCYETTNSWTYSTNTWRESNNGSTYGTSRVGLVCGLTTFVEAKALQAVNLTNLNNIATNGIGINSSSANSAIIFGTAGIVSTAGTPTLMAFYQGNLSVGSNVLHHLEIGHGSDTQTWYGDNNTTKLQSGMIVLVRM